MAGVTPATALMDEGTATFPPAYFLAKGAAGTPAASATFPLPSSLVHTPESKSPLPLVDLLRPDYYSINAVFVPSASPLEATFRHSGWAARRAKVFQAMKDIHAPQRQQEAFCECGASLWMQMNAAKTDVRLVSNGCRNRFCDPCARERAANIIANLTDKLDVVKCRFVTLTLKHSPTPLTDQIDRIYRDFLVLRRRAFWTTNVVGGAAFLECKVSEFDGLWHVHLHILVQGQWMDQRHLSSEWHAVTGDSSIVHIKPVDDPGHAAHYVTKYVTKPADASVYNNPDKLKELMISLRGRRLCYTFGTWRKFKLTAAHKSDVVWVNCGSVEGLYQRRDEGDAVAKRLLEAAERKYPTLGRIPRPPPPSADPFQ